jgi:hypothetical protein
MPFLGRYLFSEVGRLKAKLLEVGVGAEIKIFEWVK